MPRLELFLVSASCSVDQISGRVSLFDIVIEATPPSFPSLFPRLVSTASFVLDDADIGQEFQFTVRAMWDGNELAVARANFVGRERHHNLISNWFGIPVTGPGSLTFDARLNEEHVAGHLITIRAADVANPLHRQLLVPAGPAAAPIRRDQG
jgi:hypothetical protein